MPLKTSVYLSDELTAAVRACGVPLAEIVRRGMGAADPDEALVSAAASRAAAVIREDLASLMAEAAGMAARDVAEAMLGEQREIITAAVRSALADVQGGF